MHIYIYIYKSPSFRAYMYVYEFYISYINSCILGISLPRLKFFLYGVADGIMEGFPFVPAVPLSCMISTLQF